MILTRSTLSMLFTWLLAGSAVHAQFISGRQTTSLTLPTVSQHAVTTQRIGLTDLSVVYSRPLVGGRKIWGDVVKYGEIWRAGANENTTFETSDPITVEGKTLAAGIYGVHMIPGQDTWTVIFSKNHTSWGSFTYDEKEDALRVTVKPTPAEPEEALLFEFHDPRVDSVELRMKWEKICIPVKIAVDVKGTTLSSIRNQLRGLQGFTWEPWDDAATWLTDNKTNLDLALQWEERSIAMQPRFQNLQGKSRILAELGRKDEAAVAQKAALEKASPVEAYSFGRQLQFQGKQPEAIAIFREVARKDADSWLGHLALARVYSSQHDFPTATKEIKIALAGAPAPNRAAIEKLMARLEAGSDINM